MPILVISEEIQVSIVSWIFDLDSFMVIILLFMFMILILIVLLIQAVDCWGNFDWLLAEFFGDGYYHQDLLASSGQCHIYYFSYL